ncbi:MAG: N-acyl-D-amino-acid deacylase [Acetobacteraceae bacterium]|jgi:N-acyl-D-aspartate/D-glutamate deacylase|nr:N-acyl-D-amino-acid deacylase [Acetobacteraceae bacterium]
MAYDLLIRNGRIVDGSGMPAFRGDVAVKDGKIVEIGKLSGPATRIVDADGMVVAPGFIDNHCHYDAQVSWDPMCSFSCDHGATTVIFGNCSLSLAPVRPGKSERLAEFLSYVEAIPMEVLRTVDFNWETVPQYIAQLDRNLGVNVGNLIGHSAVRYYVMGDECQKRVATDAEIKEMQDVVRDGIRAGALGISVSRNQGHYDPQGVHVPALWAEEKEIFALCDVLRELGTGIIQAGGGNGAEMKDGLMSRLSEATGRPLVYNNLNQSMRRPSEWKEQMAKVDESFAKGIRAYPTCTPNRITDFFTMRNTQTFRGLPTWHPLLLASHEEKLRAYSDPEVRRKLHEEAVEFKSGVNPPGISRTWWDYMTVQNAVLPKNKGLEGKTVGEIAKARGKGVIDAFLDLVVEEDLDTAFLHGENNVDDEAVAKILNYPNAIIGLSDGGAHVQFQSGFGFSTRLLGEWVREKQIMSLETAVKRLTFESATVFGLHDRGLLLPGMVADIVVFNPDTVRPLPHEVVHDFPTGAMRIREPAEGIRMTVVNGHVLLEDGKHSGALPGRVLRNPYYRANHPG